MRENDRRRIALVTGANRGLGRAIAVALGAAGHDVVVTHRGDVEGAERTAALVRATGAEAELVRVDLAEPDGFPSAVAELRETLRARDADHLDVLVNNAGIGVFEPFGAVTTEGVDRVFGANVRGALLWTQAVAPLLADGGGIVFVSSSLSRHVSPATSVYAASKAAVESLARSLAVELGPRGIRVNALAPGPTATDFNGGAMRDDAALRAELGARTALGRVGEPEEIADAVVALVGPGMRWVTAQRLEVSGGVLL